MERYEIIAVCFETHLYNDKNYFEMLIEKFKEEVDKNKDNLNNIETAFYNKIWPIIKEHRRYKKIRILTDYIIDIFKENFKRNATFEIEI